MIEGVLAIPINLPFTQFNRGILARRKLVPIILDLIREKREALEEQKQHANPHKDLITSLLSIRNDDGSTTMSDEEIIDNIILVMIAGYDTTSILLTFLVRLLANNESVYSTIVRGKTSNYLRLYSSLFKNILRCMHFCHKFIHALINYI